MKGADMAESQERSTRARSVTPERFARVRAIFEAALERPVAEQQTFVADACAGDVELLWEVEGMLAADGRPDNLLEGARPPSSASDEGRFHAGTVLAGRYRILGLLGKGGMGEVYKAFDVILNQTVALKFLAATSISDAALVRFRNEVRIARQVSHPNVCRVYDLGLVEGLHFLSMEYIDGEDLASLLRRIGRLPQDTAVEFTRRICAGLAAAHDRGVLHRDLKPANIMIDGRGLVRITDFGLAGLAAEIPLSDLRSGTPAYMSPEQKAGREVTTRSDLYSLGLVLHEMFTGKSRTGTQSSPAELVKDLDPAIERLILQCLDEEPKRRPPSALSVAMALPGADPVAAALAAGETPSPEMIAAWQEKEGFSRRAAILCYGGVVLALVAGLWISETTSFLARAPLPIPPDALADRAQQLLRSIGYPEESRSSDYQFTCCDQQAVENLYRYPVARRAAILASHRPAIRDFQYYQYRLASPLLSPPPSLESPAPGTISERLDANGRLLRLEVRPWLTTPATSPIDWAALFAAAGLDRDRFAPTPPAIVPPMSSDARLAWSGTYADDRMEQVRVEAAAWQGLPVFFEVQPLPVQPARPLVSVVPSVALIGVLLLSVVAGLFAAWRNLRHVRIDHRGAAVMAAVAFTLAAGGRLLGANALKPDLVLEALNWSAFVAASFWVVYVAAEPYLRRSWPDSLVSWTRLCNGTVRNAVVASHILAAIAWALAFGLVAERGFNALSGGFSIIKVGETSFDRLLNSGLILLALGLANALVAALLRPHFRRPFQADLVVAVIFAPAGALSLYGLGATGLILSSCLYTAAGLVQMWLLRRFGFLPSVLGWLVMGLVETWPLTVTGWFAGRSLVVHLLPVVVATWALWVILSVPRQPARESEM